LTGVSIPSPAPSRGIAPLIASISARRPARWSRSIEGFAPGICAPNARTYSTGFVCHPVNVFLQPRIPDSGAALFDTVVEPGV
jgi:hypothetical protein